MCLGNNSHQLLNDILPKQAHYVLKIANNYGLCNKPFVFNKSKQIILNKPFFVFGISSEQLLIDILPKQAILCLKNKNREQLFTVILPNKLFNVLKIVKNYGLL